MNDVTWLPIPGFPHHEVSSDGRVRSIERHIVSKRGHRCTFPGRELRTNVNRYGYEALGLAYEGRHVNCLVHRLVCLAFYGEPPTPLHEVRHLNGNSLDNRVENVCWGTRSENMLDKVRHGTHNNTRKTHCKSNHPFDQTNTYINRHGDRRCRQCSRDCKKRKAKERKQAAC